VSGLARLREIDRATVLKGDRIAGVLERSATGTVFTYSGSYLDDPAAAHVVWSLPKREQPHRAEAGSVPVFFAGLLPEGVRLRGAIAATKTSIDDHFDARSRMVTTQLRLREQQRGRASGRPDFTGPSAASRWMLKSGASRAGVSIR
jgi:HipA-like protein